MKGYDYSADQEIGEIADEIEAEIVRGSIGPECTRVQAGEIEGLVAECQYWSRAERIAIRTAFRVVQRLSDAAAKDLDEPDGELGAPTSTFLPAIQASISACPIGTLI